MFELSPKKNGLVRLASDEMNEYFIWSFRKVGTYPEEHSDKCGKWLIFGTKDDIDSLWARVRQLTQDGWLGGTSKVSTKKNAEQHGGKFVICVYTHDHADDADKTRIYGALWAMGIRPEKYKTDQETIQGIER